MPDIFKPFLTCGEIQGIITNFCCQGIWGTVCDDYFGKNEAKVVCRMLGFSPEDVARASIYDGEKDFTATSGPIWVRFTNGTIPSNAVAQRCSGTEGSLNECNVSIIFNCFF